MMAVNNLPVESNELMELLDGVEGTAVPAIPRTAREKKKRPLLLPSIFVVGLVLGWLVLGWWLWPVEWINAEPQNLSSEFQKVYIGLVASDYSLTRDAGRVQQILEKWDEDVLIDLLSNMIVNAASPEERERLILLAEALTLPDTEMSLTDVFLGQTVVLVGIAGSVLFLGAALMITLVPAIQKRARKRTRESEEQAILDEIREEMGELLESDDIFVEQPDAAANADEAEKEPSELEKIVSSAENEVQEEAAKAEAEAEDAEGSNAASGPLDEEDDPYLILDDDEDDDEDDDGNGDPIFDLFQEEDDSSHEIEMLAGPLPQVHMEDIEKLSQQIITQFHELTRRPAR